MVKSQNKEIDHLFLYLSFGLIILFIIILVWRMPSCVNQVESFISPTSNIEEISTESPYKSNGNILVLENDFSSKIGEGNIIIVNSSTDNENHYQYKVLSVKSADNETIIQLDKPLDLPITGKLNLHKVINGLECGPMTQACFNKDNQIENGLCYDLKSRNTVSTNCDYEKDECLKPDYIYNNTAYYLRDQGLAEECILENVKNEEIIVEPPLQSQKSITPKTFINQESDLPANMQQFAFENNKNNSKNLQIGRKNGFDIEEVGDILDIDDTIQENLSSGKPKKTVRVNPIGQKRSTVSKSMNLDNINTPSQIILNIGYNNKTETKKQNDDKLNLHNQNKDKNQPSILPFMMDTGFDGVYENYDGNNKNEMNTQSRPHQYGNAYANIDTTKQEVLPGLDLTPMASFEPLD